MNVILQSLLIILMVAGVLVLLLTLLIWVVFHRPLARTRGQVHVPGLTKPVEVVRDRWGVPHVYAASQADAYRAQGFIHAQDRLFQMDYGRRLAQGRMAEVFGPAALEADRWSRVLGFWRAAKQDLALLDAGERALLDAYAAGVNTYIAAHRSRLPAEFTILGYKPEPWTPLDALGILKVMAWAMSQNWESELLRLQLLSQLGADRAIQLEPLYPPDCPTVVPASSDADQDAMLRGIARLQASYAAASAWLGTDALAGSNNWVVGAERTTTRRPLLANDPHLTVSIPTFWYQNHLVVADGSLHVTGASLPGVPGVVIGHNEHIGWGITAGRADNQDLYMEERHPDELTWFRYNGNWEAAQVFEEHIRVRGRAEPHVETVVVTRHGPLINRLAEDDPADAAENSSLPALALRWAGHEPGTAFRALLRVQDAQDWQGFRAALAFGGEPSLNFVYADVAGNIGYQYVARVPRRRSGHGLVPAPGWDDSHEWDGFLPFDELPSAFNPPQGYLLSANNKPAPDDYPHFLGAEWYPGYRATRIERMLHTKPRFTPRDFQRMQLDVYSVQAEALVPYLIMVDGETAFERRIIRELEAWNLRLDVDSFAAAAYEVARLHLLDLVFGDKLGPLTANYLGKTRSDIFTASGFAGTAGLCLVNLLEQEESWWFHDAASGQPRSREQLLQLAIQRTAISLQQMIGREPRKWAWGKVHQVSFNHLLGRIRALRILFDRGQYPIGGDEHTVWMTGFELKLPFGLVTTSATYRQVLDVGDWDRSTAILSTGQSGQPGSRHYADHIDMWREGDQNPMPWTRQAVDQAAASTLWLMTDHR